MANFFKKNLKVIVISGVSVFLIAGLSVTLLMTGVASAGSRNRDKNRDGERSRHHVRIELTEEQIAEKIEQVRERLEQKLADEKITQEEFDDKIEALENGEFERHGRNGRRGGRTRDRDKTPTDNE